ncbi:hypothetical protein CL684_02060 [Candidatus Campbellbacteria bacterium]|nr:hypothetical protein [Candidatus Campbellbacteria bacterium]|tara:strand:+ start:53 stop:616 length:564 start_codon:yes stop_codon:yes gene_type:complete
MKNLITFIFVSFLISFTAQAQRVSCLEVSRELREIKSAAQLGKISKLEKQELIAILEKNYPNCFQKKDRVQVVDQVTLVSDEDEYTFKRIMLEYYKYLDGKSLFQHYDRMTDNIAQIDPNFHMKMKKDGYVFIGKNLPENRFRLYRASNFMRTTNLFVTQKSDVSDIKAELLKDFEKYLLEYIGQKI